MADLGYNDITSNYLHVFHHQKNKCVHEHGLYEKTSDLPVHIFETSIKIKMFTELTKATGPKIGPKIGPKGPSCPQCNNNLSFSN